MIHFLEQTLSITDYIGVFFFGLVIFEAIYDIVTKKRRYNDTLANFVIFGVNTILEKLIYGIVIYFGLMLVKEFAFFNIPNTWWSFVLALVFVDFMYYWMHRWQHEIRLFWTTHSIHHSSEEFNLGISLRISWLSSLYEWIFYAPLILVGFSFETTIVALTINGVYGVWTHSERIKKLGWLDHILVTPSNHRVHHGSNRQYLDKNYGGILILWDKWFGTFEPEIEKVKYGLTKSIDTYNPIKINFYEIDQMIKDVKSTKNKDHKWKFIFGRTGWRPRTIDLDNSTK